MPILLPQPSVYIVCVRLYWTHIWKSHAYQGGTAEQRRMIELRFTASRALKAKRRHKKVTQRQLAKTLGAAQATISKIEQASDQVSLDYYFLAMIALGASDGEIAEGINPALHPGIAQLRKRSALKYARKPAARESEYRLRRWGRGTRINSFVG